MTRKEKKALREAAVAKEVEEAFNNKKITLEIDKIFPANGEAKYSNSSYSFRVINDSLTCYLPYLGDVSTTAYGGVNMAISSESQKVINPQYIFDKEQDSYFILFYFINSERNEKWECKVQIFKNKKAYIGMGCMNRSPISYEGELVETRKKK